MGKRVAFFVLIILVSGLAILGYFLHQGRKNLLTDPYKVIDTNACFIIETVDLQSFINSVTTGSGLFGEFENVKEFEGFNTKLNYLSDQLNKQSINKILHGGVSLVSFHPSEDGKLIPFLSMTLPGDVRLRHVTECLRSSGIKEVNESDFNGRTFLSLPFTVRNQNDTAYLLISSGLLVCTTSRNLLEKASSQAGRETDIRSKPDFSRILLASGKHEDKIFVIFSNLGPLLKTLFVNDASNLPYKIAKLAGSAGGDIYMNENGLIISGFVETIDSTEILYKHKSNPHRPLDTYKVLPSSTALFETSVHPLEAIPVKNINKASDEVINLAVKLKPYIGDEITRAFFDFNGTVDENTLIIFELTNKVICEQHFLDMPGNATDIIYFQPDDQTRIPVYHVAYSGLVSVLLSDFTTKFEDRYFTFYDNFMIAGNSYITISRFLYDNLLHNTLANDLIYRDFETTLPSRSGYFFYCVPSHIIDYLAGYLNDTIVGGLKSNKNSVDKIQAFGYQFASSNEMIYNSLSVMFKDEVREESTTEWETLLDTIACIKPFFFTNHNTGNKEIFIQDMKNNAYLINSAGRVLWKVPLRERITGSVYMIDYYRNGKYQLLFSGKNNIHLLDRNGNYVERYPVKLRAPATNALALFDYDNNLDYRILIAGEDRMIYSYDKTGSVVKGWKPFRTAGTVSDEIGYFRVSGKDYIVVADDKSLYFLSRTGNIRLRLKEAVTKAGGSSLRLNAGTDISVVCSSPDGTIQHIYFDGSVRKYNIRKFSSDHSFDIFDIDADGFCEYIFIDKGILYLYDHNRTEMFTREFDSDKLGGPINFIFSGSDRKIGVYDINKELIYLIDKNGNIMNGFPLKGASMFSIGKLPGRSGWHLIVGGTDRFLYNYRLDTELK